MKPLKVTMQAFGPFLEKTVCDYTKLGDSRIFLITGPTGCGKTTILDAMTFALYGAATGGIRSFREMRNAQAPFELDTLVSFEFVLRGKTYRFLRKLHLYKKRDGTMGEQPLTAECHVLDQKGWELLYAGSERHVTAIAQELLQFTHSQFSQVIVLPQGEFRKLLLANSSEKQKILQVLFGTGRWQALAQCIQDRRKELEKQLAQTHLKIETLLSGVSAADEETLNERIGQENKALEKSDRQARMLGKQMEEAEAALQAAVLLQEKFDRLAAAKNQKDQLDNMRDQMHTLSESIKKKKALADVYPYYTSLRAAQQNLQKKQQAFQLAQAESARLEKVYEQTQQEYQQMEGLVAQEKQLQAEMLRLEGLLPDARKLLEQQKRCKALLEQQQRGAQEIEVLQSEIQPLVQRVQKNESYLAQQMEEYLTPLPGYLEEQARLQKQIDCYKQLKELKERWKMLRGKLEAEKQAHAARQNTLEQLKASLYALEEKKRRDTAHVLSSALQQGQPCPVCGSTHHPVPAPPQADAPGERQLREARQRLETAEKELLKSAQAVSAYDGEIQIVQERVASESAQLQGALDERKTIQAHAKLSEKIRQCSQYRAQHESYTKKLQILKQQVEEKQRLLQEKRVQYKGLQSDHSASEAALTDLRQRLGDLPDCEKVLAEKEKVQKAHAECAHAVETLREQKEKITRDYAAAQQARSNAMASQHDAQQEYERCRQAYDRFSQGLNVLLPQEISEPDLSEIERLQKTLDVYKTARTGNQSLLAELAAALEGKQPPAMQNLAAHRNECKESYLEVQAQRGQSIQILETLKGTRVQVKSCRKENAVLEEEYGQVARVSDFLSGNNAHKTHIQSFVLGLMLDEVVLAASRYLQKLSRGRYSLLRVDTQGGNAYRGLDIEVVDAHVGHRRPVGTLSGGEMFLASLSLAFGLAEVVQSYAGGLQLDSIFIDEGFGSLDAQTLECAMQALVDIQKEGRLVGIISHVTELKQRIAARVELTPHTAGTKLVVNPGV